MFKYIPHTMINRLMITTFYMCWFDVSLSSSIIPQKYAILIALHSFNSMNSCVCVRLCENNILVYLPFVVVITSFWENLLHWLRKLKQLVRILISDRYRFSSNWLVAISRRRRRRMKRRKYFPLYRFTDQFGLVYLFALLFVYSTPFTFICSIVPTIITDKSSDETIAAI